MTYKAGDSITFATDGSDHFFGFILQKDQVYAYVPLAKPVEASLFHVNYPETTYVRTIEGQKIFSVKGTTARTIGKSTLQFAINIQDITLGTLANTPAIISGVGFSISFS